MRWKWKILLDSKKNYIITENQQEHYTFVFDQHTQQVEQTLCFYVEAYATLTVHIIIAHTSIKVKIECILRGKGAHARIFGAYMLSDEHNLVIDTFQHHQAAHTSSTLIMKGALQGKASAHYAGTIRIEKQAPASYASQENKNILLSNQARAVSIPNLEVLHNEVKCFHASAVGKFDKDQLFYIAARGIDEKMAQQILLNAFFADVLDGNEDGEKGFYNEL